MGDTQAFPVKKVFDSDFIYVFIRELTLTSNYRSIYHCYYCGFHGSNIW